ncbi:MAG: hypothetical protein QW367_00385 [Candidatus Aenigmatarchaeota archaeon]
MSTITLLHFKTTRNIEEIEKELNKISEENYWIIASKENEKLLKIIFNYKVSLEDELRKVLSISEIRNIFNGISSQLLTRRIVAYMHFDKEILEVERGSDYIFSFFISVLEKNLKIKFINLYISSNALLKIIERYSISLNQIYFKFVNGLLFEMYKGKFLQYSDFIKRKIEENRKNIRIITILPKIKFRGTPKSITINGDKGTIKFYSKEIFRDEINQIINIIFESTKF